jgi:hypothetical protein
MHDGNWGYRTDWTCSASPLFLFLVCLHPARLPASVRTADKCEDFRVDAGGAVREMIIADRCSDCERFAGWSLMGPAVAYVGCIT